MNHRRTQLLSVLITFLVVFGSFNTLFVQLNDGKRIMMDNIESNKILRARTVLEEPNDNGFVLPPDTRKLADYDMCKGKCGRYLTVVNFHGARFGHYFSTWKASLAIAEFMGLEYIHHEFAPRNVIPARLWERFLGFSDHFEDYASMCVDRKLETLGENNYLSGGCVEYLPCLTVVQVPKMNEKDINEVNSTMTRLMTENPQCNTVFQLTTDQHFNWKSPKIHDFLVQSYADARKKYPINCYFSPSVLNIIVHIRRGDVDSRPDTLARYTSNEDYVSIIKKLLYLLEDLDYKNVLGREDYEIHLYSEGKPEDFGDIQNLPNTQFHLNDDLFETMHHMRNADILVGSFSAFSAYARTFMKGIPIFPAIQVETEGVPFKDGDFKEEHFEYWWDQRKDAIKSNKCDN